MDTHIIELLELSIVVHEVLQVVVRDVDIRVAAVLAVLFNSFTTAAEGVSVDLVLDLIGGVGQQDGALCDGGGHLALGTLQSREELGVKQGWLGVLELVGDVASETEVGILINGARDKARDVVGSAKDLREGVGEGRSGLDADEVALADVVAVIEAKGAFALVVWNGAGDFEYVLVECAAVGGWRPLITSQGKR